MKKLNILLCSFILIATTKAAIASPQLDFVGRIAKQINYAEENQQAVWPGFHPASKPTVIEFISRYLKFSAYALNFKPGSLPWKKLSISNIPVYYLANSISLNVINDDDFMDIDGQKCFVDIEKPYFLSLENLRSKIIANEASQYLMHESSIDQSNAKYMNVNYDNFNDRELLKLFYLEDRALTLSQQDDTGRAEEALRYAVAIHQYRNHLVNESARKFETGLEIMNGIPVFIGWTTQQLNEVDYRKKTERTGCMPLSPLGGPFGMFDCVMFGFPAFASSVYGHALDKKLDPRIWKQNVEKQFKSPSQFAIEYYHFTDDQAKQMTDAAIQNPEYQYDRIVRVIDHTMNPYLKSLKIAHTNYMNMSGIELRLPFEFGYMLLMIDAMNGGDGISKLYIINNNIILLEDINLKSDDDEYDFQHLPYMALNEVSKGFEVDEHVSFTSYKVSENAKLDFDDASMTASEFVRNKIVKSFHKLLVTDQHTRLSINHEATLDASQGVLILKEYKSKTRSYAKMKHFSEWMHEHINRIILKLYS